MRDRLRWVRPVVR